ncbi:MAG: hypothetical protein GY704_09085 [Phycisphaeraceae bacterium]|nr:hypothetical protein [Phycisphaeraceae bacterium]
MSFDVFVQRFVAGWSDTLDPAAVLAALEGGECSVSGGTTEGFSRIETTDGGADVYGISVGSQALMVNHIDGAQAWEAVWEVAHAIGAVVLSVGAPPIVTRDIHLEDLPPELRHECVVVADSAKFMQTATGA